MAALNAGISFSAVCQNASTGVMSPSWRKVTGIFGAVRPYGGFCTQSLPDLAGSDPEVGVA